MTRLLLAVVCVSLTGCTIYHAIDVPVNETSLKYYLPKTPRWTIQNSDQGPRYVVVDKIEADAISVTVGEPQTIPDHHPSKESYWRHYGRYHLDHFHLTTPGDFKSGTQMRIEFPDIQKAQVHDYNVGPTVTLSVLTMAAYSIGATFAIVAVACNCPHVSVMGRQTPGLEGALFPGAMSKSLARNDNLLLSQLPDTGGKVQIRISNELPETEYIDRVELFELSNVVFGNVATTSSGNPVSYEAEDRLISAITGNDRNIQDMISKADDSHYDFDELESDEELNKVTMKFRKGDRDKSMLLIRARQSPWIETVGEFFFQQFGNDFPKWVNKLDKADPARYNQSLRDRGISMNIYMKVNGDWKNIGSFDDAGTIAGRELAVPVDLTNVEGEVEIKLEAAHGLWEIDRVALSDTWNEDIELRKLKTISATNNQHKDVLSLVASTDGQYLLQPEKTSFVDLTFEAPSSPSSFVFLGGTGYYHHIRDYKAKPNYKLLRKFDSNNMTTHQLSRLMKAMSASNVTQK